MIALVLLTFLVSGCASSNVNTRKTEAVTGYVDLYTDTNADLAWDVQEAPSGAGDFETVFSDVNPVSSKVLRLPLPPGQHQLRVTLLNRVVSKPADVSVTVESGKVTPVRIVLVEAGPTVIVSKQTMVGGTLTRSGRQTNIQRNESTMYELSAIADASIPFQPEQQMPYIR